MYDNSSAALVRSLATEQSGNAVSLIKAAEQPRAVTASLLPVEELQKTRLCRQVCLQAKTKTRATTLQKALRCKNKGEALPMKSVWSVLLPQKCEGGKNLIREPFTPLQRVCSTHSTSVSVVRHIKATVGWGKTLNKSDLYKTQQISLKLKRSNQWRDERCVQRAPSRQTDTSHRTEMTSSPAAVAEVVVLLFSPCCLCKASKNKKNDNSLT